MCLFAILLFVHTLEPSRTTSIAYLASDYVEVDNQVQRVRIVIILRARSVVDEALHETPLRRILGHCTRQAKTVLEKESEKQT